LVSTAVAQQDFSKIEIKATQVSGNVYMLEGSGGNIGVSVGADGILIVDDQFAPLADKIAAALAQLNPGKLKYVLNTHHHGDHTGGNAAFGAKDATIIAQANVRLNLAKDPKTPAVALPVITFDHGATVYFNGEDISATHYGPAHTNGDSVIRFKNANVIHMGDQMMTERFPFIDFSSGGDLDGLMANWKTVIAGAPADVKIIPGHGRLATLDDLKTLLAIVEESTALVRQGMAEGKTLEQLRTAGLPEKFKSWGSGFINTNRWIETIYNQSHKDAPKK
jgi:glyoxylase-like metal-dependent hydrolase (beta-lactamase superfamily II)